MQFSYQLTLPEFKVAFRLHARQKIGRRLYYFIYDFVFPALATLSLGITAYMYLTGQREGVDGFIFLDYVLVGLVLVLFFIRNRAIRIAFRGLFPPGNTERTTSFDINEEQIIATVKGVGEGRYLWDSISSFVQNDVLALIYITEIRFLVLPLRVLSSDQRAELNDLATRHGLRKQK